MILSESWGASQDKDITRKTLQPYQKGKPTFSGIFLRKSVHTQGAETEDFRLMKALREKRFEKWYLHGYDRDFYKGRNQYSSLGFDTLLFKEDFQERGMPLCKLGFTAICDSSIAAFIDKLMEKPDKYIFWTTVDTHPPYDDNIPGINEASIYFNRHANTARLATELARKHPEYRIIVRGDHNPMVNFQKGNTPEVRMPSFLYRWVPMVIFN